MNNKILKVRASYEEQERTHICFGLLKFKERNVKKSAVTENQSDEVSLNVCSNWQKTSAYMKNKTKDHIKNCSVI